LELFTHIFILVFVFGSDTWSISQRLGIKHKDIKIIGHNTSQGRC